LWEIFALLDPDLDSGYGSTDLIESESETLAKTPGKPEGPGKPGKTRKFGRTIIIAAPIYCI
jgi:hypothetical protein